MAVETLDKVTEERASRPVKGYSGTALAALNLTSSFQRLGNADGYHLGNNPSISAFLRWTYTNAAHILTVRLKVSHNGTDWIWAPSFGSPTVSAPSATSVANIAEASFLASTWNADTLLAWCPFEAYLSRWRYFQPWVKSSGNDGSIAATSTVLAGTQE